MDQQQAQYGLCIQSKHMARYRPLCKSFLHVRRLQLGLVAAARVATMSAQQIACDGREGTARIPHRRMVSSSICQLQIEIQLLLFVFVCLFVCFDFVLQWRPSQEKEL